jgi:hypothetical protein
MLLAQLPLGSLFHRTDPACDAALSSVNLGGWHPKHLVKLSPERCAVLAALTKRGHYSRISKRFIPCGTPWKKNFAGGWTAHLPYGQVSVFQLLGGGWCMQAQTEYFQHARRGDCRYVLTQANSGEAVISVPDLELAKVLALHVYRRAQTGDVESPLPGIKLRPIPHDFYEGLHDDNRQMKYALALDASCFDGSSRDFVGEFDGGSRRTA